MGNLSNTEPYPPSSSPQRRRSKKRVPTWARHTPVELVGMRQRTHGVIVRVAAQELYIKPRSIQTPLDGFSSDERLIIRTHTATHTARLIRIIDIQGLGYWVLAVDGEQKPTTRRRRS